MNAAVLYPVFARTEPQACGSCGASVYFTLASITGLHVAVEIAGPDTYAPTRRTNGMGRKHECDATAGFTP